MKIWENGVVRQATPEEVRAAVEANQQPVPLETKIEELTVAIMELAEIVGGAE